MLYTAKVKCRRAELSEVRVRYLYLARVMKSTVMSGNDNSLVSYLKQG